jgi:hypothetical protein
VLANHHATTASLLPVLERTALSNPSLGLRAARQVEHHGTALTRAHLDRAGVRVAAQVPAGPLDIPRVQARVPVAEAKALRVRREQEWHAYMGDRLAVDDRQHRAERACSAWISRPISSCKSTASSYDWATG